MSTKRPIARFRAERGMTLKAFGDHFDVNPRTVMRWESGKTPIPIKRLRKIETFTGIPRHELRPDIFEAAE